MSLELIGAGFGRTGTLSLKTALERLGYGPCYHMTEVESHPEHDEAWLRAAKGQSVDWHQLFAGYRATVDWPACNYWQPLMAEFPGAKVILSWRDPDSWYKSISRTILPALEGSTDDLDDTRRLHRQMTRETVIQGAFGGALADAELAKKRFVAHAEAVKAGVPSSRLLVYEVGSGWGPLCEFLGCPVPDEPYPRSNSTAEFLKSDNAQDEAHRRRDG